MSTAKTAISIDSMLLHRIDDAARKRKVTRSRFLAEAAEQQLKTIEDAEILASWNQAYADGPDEQEMQFLHAANRNLARIIQEQEK